MAAGSSSGPSSAACCLALPNGVLLPWLGPCYRAEAEAAVCSALFCVAPSDAATFRAGISTTKLSNSGSIARDLRSGRLHGEFLSR
jgi:hypothetical protein